MHSQECIGHLEDIGRLGIIWWAYAHQLFEKSQSAEREPWEMYKFVTCTLR